MFQTRILGLFIVLLACASCTQAIPRLFAPPFAADGQVAVAVSDAERALARLVTSEEERSGWTTTMTGLLLAKDVYDVSQLEESLFEADEGGGMLLGALYSGLTLFSCGERAVEMHALLSGHPSPARRAYLRLPAGDAATREAAARAALARLAVHERRYRLTTGLVEAAFGVYLLIDQPFAGELRDRNRDGVTLSLFGALRCLRSSPAEKAWRKIQ